MARPTLMTWEGSPNFRWKKMLAGKWYRVTTDQLGIPQHLRENKENSYQAANEWWRAKAAELAADPVGAAVDTLPTQDALIDMIRRGDMAQAALVLKNSFGEDRFFPPINLEEEKKIASSIAATSNQLANGKNTPKDFTLSALVDKFIEDERARVGAKDGDIKPETYGEVSVYVVRLKDILGKGLDVRQINEDSVRTVNLWVKGCDYVKSTKRKVWRIFKRFFRYLWSMRLIELPRNLEEEGLKIKVRPKKVKRFDLGEVKTFLAGLNPRKRLYGLLGLNCGMLGVDMASLTWDQLDQKDWRITRQRTKTEDASEDVPTVSYKLWPATVKLFKACLSKDKTYVLTSSVGTVLWKSWVDATGKRKKNDLITQQWKRTKRAGKPWFNLKNFRSIGATVIGDSKEFGRYYHHFLGHSPTSMGDKHYVPPSQVLFDEIMVYVGKVLGLA